MDAVNLSGEKVHALFESRLGGVIYKRAIDTLREEIGVSCITGGVLVGFSGGADSLMLLLLLYEYRWRERLDFPLVACHVNHGIRGDEAERDMHISEEICRLIGVPFISRTFDVPSIARERGIGVEEAARECRYSCFEDIISGRNDISSVAVAHNADDNAETVLFNMARGCGTRGMRGILPSRDNIIRPLIRVSAEDIRAALDSYEIFYAKDSTNLSTDYTRNFIRHEIMPRLGKISNASTEAIGRMTRAVACDNDFLDMTAADVYEKIKGKRIKAESLLALHPAIFSRVINLWFADLCSESLEFRHISDIRHTILKDNSSVSLPGGICFICERGLCRFMKEKSGFGNTIPRVSISFGENRIPGTNGAILLGDEAINISSNIYNFSIQADLSSAIIKGGLYIRSREAGDSYRYGGMTHKLKKLFNDRNIPPTLRDNIPILCDEAGIVWVPGLGVRDDGGAGRSLPVRFVTYNEGENDIPLISALAWRE